MGSKTELFVVPKSASIFILTQFQFPGCAEEFPFNTTSSWWRMLWRLHEAVEPRMRKR